MTKIGEVSAMSAVEYCAKLARLSMRLFRRVGTRLVPCTCQKCQEFWKRKNDEQRH